MYRCTVVLTIGVIGFIAACSIDITPSVDTTSFVVSATTLDPGTQTLAVSLSGINHYNSPGTYTFTAGAGGGNGSYTYDFFVETCDATLTYCWDDDLVQEGGANSLHQSLTGDLGEAHVHVHVYDTSSPQYSGSASIRVINTSNPGSLSTYPDSCEPGANFAGGGFFPVLEVKKDSAGNLIFNHFHRNFCTGARVYQEPWPPGS